MSDCLIGFTTFGSLNPVKDAGCIWYSNSEYPIEKEKGCHLSVLGIVESKRFVYIGCRSNFHELGK